MRLEIIITSTRPGRVGPSVARWFHEHAKLGGGTFEVNLTDLAEVGLPLLDEPNHPSKRDYLHDHTKRWSAIVDAADAFVFVIPEYNYTAPPTFFNALDYLYQEWAYKPVGLVSYGGVSGGLRSSQSTKPILTTLRMMPLPEQVMIPNVSSLIKDGAFAPDIHHRQSADAMLAELAKWAGALKGLRGT